MLQQGETQSKRIRYQRLQQAFNDDLTMPNLQALLCAQVQYRHCLAREGSRKVLGLTSPAVFIKRLNPLLVPSPIKIKVDAKDWICINPMSLDTPKRKLLRKFVLQHGLSQVQWEEIRYERPTPQYVKVTMAQKRKLQCGTRGVVRVYDTYVNRKRATRWICALSTKTSTVVSISESWLKKYPHVLAETDYVLHKEFGTGKQMRDGVETLVRIVKFQGFRKLECLVN